MVVTMTCSGVTPSVIWMLTVMQVWSIFMHVFEISQVFESHLPQYVTV